MVFVLCNIIIIGSSQIYIKFRELKQESHPITDCVLCLITVSQQHCLSPTQTVESGEKNKDKHCVPPKKEQIWQ